MGPVNSFASFVAALPHGLCCANKPMDELSNKANERAIGLNDSERRLKSFMPDFAASRPGSSRARVGQVWGGGQITATSSMAEVDT
jgi:hypothetical protein